MFNVFRKEIEWGGRPLKIETGKIGRQADASVIVTYGETVVHCAVCAAKTAPEGMEEDFLPLTVNYQEKAYAAGRIPGGFFKREGRPDEHEILSSRLIDRPIRPLFAKGYHNDTQVTCTVLSHDMENDPDIVAMISASAALAFSGLPFLGPIGAARIGYRNGEYILNPTLAERGNSELDLVVAGTDQGVLMVESEAQELTEATMLNAVMFGHENMQPVINMINEMKAECGKEAWPMPEEAPEYKIVYDKFMENYGEQLREAYKITDKLERQNTIADIREAAKISLGDNEAELAVATRVFHEMEYHTVRDAILETGVRIDGRDTKTVRPITAEVGVLPRAHGSALFTRGETQALVVATLGTDQDEQIVDALTGEYHQSFMLHYNFPPYSVGETGKIGSPGRREIGHGKLAWRAIHPMLPSKEEFPYSIRVVSEIMESNGSSSMATVCGSCLSLMDAGVPMKHPVAGIAMGLIKEPDGRFAVLTDILGDEDHLGDMDFKVAGTKDGVTSLQMDIKITSITKEIMEIALKQAKEGRLHILGKMAEAIEAPRDAVSENAPRITTMQINKDKIRDVIGTGGKVIREITEQTGCKIDISEDGVIKIASFSQAAGEAAYKWIEGIVSEAEVGKIYDGKVVKVVEFGAFVNFLGSKDGLVHISELAQHRVAKVTDVVNEGDKVKVKCVGIDNRGKVKLSMKCVDQETGAEIEVKKPEKAEHKEEKKEEKKDAE
ncbi:MAG: polyribonucleotide nucleotidyltransferase [Alphaproteobacteria bacterium]|nr:polyribonucleotide nucleotidyltransferase [Alphaproteobacteria bacterium]